MSGRISWLLPQAFVSGDVSSSSAPTDRILDTVWSGFWGLVYRKFFWDFVNGIIRNPGGVQCVLYYTISLPYWAIIRPANQDKIFIQVIVQVPIIQILAMIIGFIILAIELPLPPVKNLSIYRSFVVRIVLLAVQAFLTILYYQVRSAPQSPEPLPNTSFCLRERMQPCILLWRW